MVGKLVDIIPITMVHGYHYSIHAGYKPTYNYNPPYITFTTLLLGLATIHSGQMLNQWLNGVNLCSKIWWNMMLLMCSAHPYVPGIVFPTDPWFT